MTASQALSTPIPLPKDKIQAAGEVLARAFYDDPGSKYIIPEDPVRAKLLPNLFVASVRYGYLYGLCHVTPGSVDGATVWLTPGQTDTPVWKMIRSGLVSAYLRVGIGRVGRALNYINCVEAWHHQYTRGLHWYLFLIGVEPHCQGQGIGASLLEPVLRQADSNGHSCYLETGKERNLAFYQRHGFSLIAEHDISNGGPHIWCMLRNPR